MKETATKETAKVKKKLGIITGKKIDVSFSYTAVVEETITIGKVCGIINDCVSVVQQDHDWFKRREHDNFLSFIKLQLSQNTVLWLI